MNVGKIQKTYSYLDVLAAAKREMQKAVADTYKDLTGKKIPKSLQAKLDQDQPERAIALDAIFKSTRRVG